MTQLLILSVSAGNGHVRAAQALAATAESMVPPVHATHIDAMAHVAGGFRKVYTDWYLQLVNRAPEVWSYLHQRADITPHSATSQRLRRGIERVSAGALLREIHRAKPDAIVCTHFLPAELLMREQTRGRIDCPVWLQVTDYDLHNMWIVPGMAGYLAATEEVAFRMRARGLPSDRIHVTGIPVMPAFARPDAPALARDANVMRIGLDPARKVVLMAAGGAGVGDLPSMVARVLAIRGAGSDFQVVAVAGRNAAALQALEALAQKWPGRLVALGFTNEMEKLMAAADLVVTKPGGLTISECLALGKPMLLVSPIPGQEEHNAGFLLEESAAWLAYDAIGLEYKIARLMAAPEQLARMAHKSHGLGKPDAARAVLNCVLSA
ncbi:MGDG synthase family glycosyltransferase [Variovorax sp. PAMC 28711]|uniref:MGDG synthase family glycosyltransferase n=1 Tax=Variovorax sp. PAMC 28711 TaxID=1795631 RepID=UPI00078C6962|nr:glycosyltransferase [Variovorax sp. PAMC 28711]AMM24269.1 galactosyldiacylglycerol synthase [Variovorax sp. PAMC 28711]